jgi:hypothetical protein
VAAAIQEGVSALAAEVEVVRGLPFVVVPEISVLRDATFDAAWEAVVAGAIDSERLALDTGLYRLFGLLGPGDDMEAVLRALPPPATVAYYDPGAFTLVVSDAAAELTPTDRSSIVHELVHAVVDQHFAFGRERAALAGAGADDPLVAYDALVEGDATYFQLVYLQGLDQADRIEVALAFASTDSAAIRDLPDFVRATLAFPYEEGFTFVRDLVEAGGIARVDQAYREPPTTSAQILNPARYLAGGGPRRVVPLELDLGTATITPATTFGQHRLDALLTSVIPPDLVTQTVDGWDGDTYQLVADGDEIGFALIVQMLSPDDAIEVVDALVAHADEVIQAGEGIEVDGGLLWSSDDVYIFVDRVGDSLRYLLASDPTLGARLRTQVPAP